MAETLADLLREAGIDYSGAATRVAEQTPYTPSTPLRRPTPGPSAREAQRRMLLGAPRDIAQAGRNYQQNYVSQLRDGRLPDAVRDLPGQALELTGLPSFRRAGRAAAEGDLGGAALNAGAGALGLMGMGVGMAPRVAMAEGQVWRPAVSARTYRGMDRPFDPDRVAPRGPYGYGRDTSEWSAADPAVANGYAEGQRGANVESLRTEMARPLRVDAGGALYTDLPRQAIPDRGIQRRLARGGAVDTEALAAAARRSGRYDGVVLENVRDPRHMNEPGAGDKPTTVYATLYPRMSRPEFGPRPVEFDPGQPDLFDPARRPLLGAARAPAEAAAVARGARMPLTELEHFDPIDGMRPWDLRGRPLEDETVTRALASGRSRTEPFNDAPNWSGQDHADRIATLVRDGWDDPITLGRDADNAPYIVDGYHRLAAARLRGDKDIAYRYAVTESPQRIPRAIQPQIRASDGTILPAQPRETFGRPFSRTAASSGDLREAAQSGPFSRTAGTSGDLREASAMQPQLRGGTPEALQRAREQGYHLDETLSHGTGEDFTSLRGPVSLAQDFETSSTYAGHNGGNPRVLPLVRRGRLMDWPNSTEQERALMGRVLQSDGKDTEAVRALEVLGITGYQAKGMPGREIVMFPDADGYVRNIRSRFAAFDPARSGESDLLASVGAPVAAAALFGGRKRRK